MREKIMFIVTTNEMLLFINSLKADIFEQFKNFDGFNQDYLVIANNEFNGKLNTEIKNILYGDYNLMLFDILDNLRIAWYIFGLFNPKDYDEITETIHAVGADKYYVRKIT